MTDISTEQVTLPAPPPPAPAAPAALAPAPASESSGAGAGGVGHTSGGWPVVPLATTGANSTIGGVAAAALATSPGGALVAAAGAATLGAVVLARRAVRNRAAKTTSRAGAKKMPAPRQSRNTASSTAARSAGSHRTAGRKGGTGAGRAAKGRTAAGSSGASPAGSGRGRASSGTQPKGRVGQVKALRQAARSSAAPTRAERRSQAVQARRAVADSRRHNTPHRTGPAKPTMGSSSRAGRSGSGLGGKVRAGRDAAVRRARAARDRAAARAVDASRGKVRAAATAKQTRAMKRAVRKQARHQLWRSALRKQGRRLLAALLAAPVGVLGMLTTPLGRKLGIKALQYPGRRLYRRLMRTAEEQQAVRDAEIRERRQAAEDAIDAELADNEQQIGGTVERPFHLTPASPSSPLEVVNVSGFKFEEAAAEMENAARTYEPDNAMEILAMVENLPDALTSVANTFRILAERSDSEFPLEKDIAAAFDEIYGALMRAVDSSGDLGPLFQQVHEHDIARHTDPRNGPEAEKGWNV
ncbi:hypothetical protein [Streptomyces venezuelae]|uniref:hypothetical protein n=1 Tax=Streptomyces venezuelae TaxID=54571 RepID=UPI0037CE0E11